MSPEILGSPRGSTALGRMLLAASVLTGGTAIQAFAQNVGSSSPVAGDQLSEVVVTAQFRTENLQTAPLAITAITSQMIEDRSMTNVTDIASDVPSTTLLTGRSAFGPSMTALIRGIGQSDFDPALEPGVGVYVDDVYYATLIGSALDLLDLDRVEVLRGPQGTLEGMNSIGGAIKLFSKKPDDTAGTSLDLLYGSRNHIEARGSSDFVVVPDQLFVRMSAVYNHQDGYVNVFDFGCSHPSFTATPVDPTTGVPDGPAGTYSIPPGFVSHAGSCLKGQEGGTDYQGLRLSARWLPSDRVTVDVSGDIIQQDQENPAETLLYADKPTITIAATNTATGATAFLPYSSTLVPSILSPNRYTSYVGFSLPAFPGAANSPVGPLQPQAAYSAPDDSRLLSWGTQATVNWKLNESLALTSISGFRGYSATWYHDGDASEWPLQLSGEYLQHHQFSEELRLNGSVGKLVDFTLGGFYFDENTIYGSHEDLWFAAGPGALNFLSNDPVPAKDEAGFLHAVWHLTNKLDFITGVRYTGQSKDYTYVRVNPEGGTGGSASLVGSLNGVTGYYSAHKADYRADVDYQWTANLMTYAQVSTGFKGGGVNPRPFFAFQAVPFAPETVTTAEVGIKSSWFSNTLRVNLDGYFSRYKDIQLTLLNCGFLNPPGFAIPPAATPCALPYNTGNADIKGIELEVEAHPMSGLEINASGSYLNFKYTSLSSLPTGVTTSMTTPYTPEWQGNIGLEYKIPLGSWGSITPRLDASMRTDIYTDAVNAPTNHIGGYTLYNARITWRPEQGNWEASLLALNLTDHFYYLNSYDITGAGGGSVTGTPGAPLEVALEVRRKF
ncbi:MAG TPA: TonB-dependent receptor [Steroidobacteraceae bacterium]|nr:TonB-dependent receptor [Steroidobacteraceae bacterium]